MRFSERFGCPGVWRGQLWEASTEENARALWVVAEESTCGDLKSGASSPDGQIGERSAVAAGQFDPGGADLAHHFLLPRAVSADRHQPAAGLE
jgi:hypothetical protein